ncbi:MAG: hypothetical protein CMH83_19045 [Nocardioides sp.]|nr:hypothetical protein [Nocardioides sp.]
MTDKPLSEAERKRYVDGIDKALGLTSPAQGATKPVRDAFVECGFTLVEADLGVRMLESGRYFGFADAATSLRSSGIGGAAMSPIMRTAIEAKARQLEEAGHVKTERAQLAEARRGSKSAGSSKGAGR